MSNLNSLKNHTLAVRNLKPLARQLVSLCLSLILTIGMAFSYSQAAQAAVDTTSAATQADANQIKQRKENAPHYPNWYNDQRSLESYMDKAGVDGNDDSRSLALSDQRDKQGNLIERSRDRLRDVAADVRGTLTDSSQTSGKSGYSDAGYADDRADASEVKNRAANRIEQAKEVFQGATERAAEGSVPIITGESNR